MSDTETRLTEDGGEQAIMVAAQPPSSPQVPDVSSRLGELLLQGYAMLAETCPDCPVPLMRRPGTTDTLCVQCGKTNAADRIAEQDAPHTQGQVGVVAEAARIDSAAPTASLANAAPAARPPPAPSASDAAAEPAQDASQALADHMLRGWALLQDQCPICGTLLLRSRAGERRCVSCAMPVRSSDEAAASSSLAARESTLSRAREGPGPAQAPRIAPRREAEIVNPTRPAPVGPPSSAPSRDAAAAVSVEGASRAVALALESATRRLEDLHLTPAAPGVAEDHERAFQAVLGTVQRCAQALASLHACQSAAAAMRWSTR